MSNLIVTNITSIDGYYEGPGGNVMALPMDDSFDRYCAERLEAAETLLLGATTFRGFSGFWPPVAENPSATDTQRQISRLDNAIDKVAISESLSLDDAGAWKETTQIIGRAEAHAAVAERKQSDGGDILVFGSRTLWHDLLSAGLVDEIHLVVGGVALGGGTPAFPDRVETKLSRLGARTSEDSPNVVLQYAVER